MPDPVIEEAIAAACTRWREARGVDCPVVDVGSSRHPGESAVDLLFDLGIDAMVTLFTDPDMPLEVVRRRRRTIGHDLMLGAVLAGAAAGATVGHDRGNALLHIRHLEAQPDLAGIGRLRCLGQFDEAGEDQHVARHVAGVGQP